MKQQSRGFSESHACLTFAAADGVPECDAETLGLP